MLKCICKDHIIILFRIAVLATQIDGIFFSCLCALLRARKMMNVATLWYSSNYTRLVLERFTINVYVYVLVCHIFICVGILYTISGLCCEFKRAHKNLVLSIIYLLHQTSKISGGGMVVVGADDDAVTIYRR